jgi:pimeloyl-ACP methyl ester carboxylesterase
MRSDPVVKTNPRRLFRLLLVAMCMVPVAYLIVNIGVAWLYVNSLTQSGCRGTEPLALSDLSAQVHWLNTSDHLRLRAYYYPPKNGAVILSLGGPGGALGDTLPPVRFLLENGYGVLQIDSRSCAEPTALVTLGANETRDAAAALDFLAQRAEVKHIGAMGFSMGGVTAIRSAARFPEIEAIVAEGGFYNLADDFLKEEGTVPLHRRLLLFTIAGVFWARTGVNPWQVSPIDDLPLISPRPVYLIYGEHEALSGHAQEQFDAAKQPKRFWLVPSGGHGRNHLARQEQYTSSILAFFDESLLK